MYRVECRCTMLRQILCAEQLRFAIAHGHATVKHVSFRASGTAFPKELVSQSHLERRFLRHTPTMSATSEHQHTNRLAKEQSPYLLQHQYNPVRCLSAIAHCTRTNALHPSVQYHVAALLCNLHWLVLASHGQLSQAPCLQVDWYPWGQEAFDKAKKEDKPIFLSVGYSTCHWCAMREMACAVRLLMPKG